MRSTETTQETESRTHVDLPGAATSVTVPEGQKALLVVRCSASSNGDSWESHAIDRSRGPLGPGTYPVTVQWRADGENQFMLWGWHLTVERVKAG